ncbi:MAG TPA: hypothetical protein VE685_15625, partial [Thermoanaerobaculia bacterium]|nr:hypothetical protein [Thermoanaerobaculia bacterium]
MQDSGPLALIERSQPVQERAGSIPFGEVESHLLSTGLICLEADHLVKQAVRLIEEGDLEGLLGDSLALDLVFLDALAEILLDLGFLPQGQLCTGAGQIKSTEKKMVLPAGVEVEGQSQSSDRIRRAAAGVNLALGDEEIRGVALALFLIRDLLDDPCGLVEIPPGPFPIPKPVERPGSQEESVRQQDGFSGLSRDTHGLVPEVAGRSELPGRRAGLGHLQGDAVQARNRPDFRGESKGFVEMLPGLPRPAQIAIVLGEDRVGGGLVLHRAGLPGGGESRTIGVEGHCGLAAHEEGDSHRPVHAGQEARGPSAPLVPGDAAEDLQSCRKLLLLEVPDGE